MAGPWWGEYQLGLDETACWQVGPMALWVQRRSNEWRVLHETDGDGAEAFSVEVPTHRTLPDRPEVQRFVFEGGDRRLRLQPILADRPIISRPENPLYLPPGEEVTLFVSAPAWLRLTVGPAERLLAEFPLMRLSDTWFGSPTATDGLAYAARTRALTDLASVPVSPYRAITALRVRNRARNTLAIDRINLPVLFLALYHAENGALWTQDVTLEHDEDETELALLKLDKGGPAAVPGAVKLAEPRRGSEKNLMIQAFSKLFS